MQLILPILFSWIILILKGEYDDIISKYLIFILLLSILNITICTIKLLILIPIIFTLIFIITNNNSFNDSFSLLFLMGIIFIFFSNSLISFFISIEFISFLMITFINIYIIDVRPGILYYLFSGIFSALFILSLGYLYIGYIISYYLLILVFIWKLGLGPLHILMPYIYNSLSPKKIIFIDIMCKYLLFYAFNRLMIFIPINIILFISIISMIIGVILILKENNLLNILIYSSIINYGLLLIGLYSSIFYIYLIFYFFMVIIYLFLIIYKSLYINIYSFYIKFLWFILIFNLIGIPPFNGFWIKFYILESLIINHSFFISFFILLLLLFLSSVYIRLLLNIVFNNLNNNYIITNNSFYSHFISFFIISLSLPIFI